MFLLYYYIYGDECRSPFRLCDMKNPEPILKKAQLRINDNNNNIASTFVVCYCRAFCSASDVCGPTTLMAERQQNREVWSHKNFMRH